MALATGVLIVANQGLGLNLPQGEIMTVAGIAISFIIGESARDAVAASKK